MINALKDELADVSSSWKDKTVLVSADSCGSPVTGDADHRAVFVKFDSVSADVTLKTVATDSLAGSGGVSKVPIGAILLTGGSTLTRTNIVTQQVVYSLDEDLSGRGLARADRAKTAEHEASVTVGREESLSNQAFHPSPGGFIRVHRIGEDTKAAPVASPGVTSAPPPKPDYGIAKAIIKAREQILLIDHARKPCVTPTKVKVQVDFQVQEKLDSKIDVGFLVLLDIGSESVRQREAAQSLVVTFSLKGSSEAVD